MALHLVSILDMSGSMGGTETEVINAYNTFISDHKKLAEEKNIKIKATLVLFDNRYLEIYSKVKIKEVPVLTNDVYKPCGMTALYDAVGKTINSFEGKDKVIFFIETDGWENASVEFNSKKIKELVDRKTKDGWEFKFVGADLSDDDVVNIAKGLGISASKTMAFSKTNHGYTARTANMLDTTSAYIDTHK